MRWRERGGTWIGRMSCCWRNAFRESARDPERVHAMGNELGWGNGFQLHS